ncbi:hypothetical protein [Leptospira noguchii]|uniref:hypothetical protein n=1 Tax=Leptospira noguchii TaxID=28182 RepID=UPI0026802A22
MDQDRLLERITYKSGNIQRQADHSRTSFGGGTYTWNACGGRYFGNDIRRLSVVRIGRHPSTCLVYAYRMIGHERIENIPKETALTEIYTKNIMTPPTLNNVAANMPTRRTNSWSY